MPVKIWFHIKISEMAFKRITNEHSLFRRIGNLDFQFQSNKMANNLRLSCKAPIHQHARMSKIVIAHARILVDGKNLTCLKSLPCDLPKFRMPQDMFHKVLRNLACQLMGLFSSLNETIPYNRWLRTLNSLPVINNLQNRHVLPPTNGMI